MRKFLLPALIVVGVLVLWFVLNPPRFWLNMTKSVDMTSEVGAQLVDEKDCRGCHRIGGEGALKASPLDPVVQRP